MAKAAEETETAVPIVEEPQALSIQEWCINKSKTCRHVELIGAFEREEIADGRAKDESDAYEIRYVEFCERPA